MSVTRRSTASLRPGQGLRPAGRRARLFLATLAGTLMGAIGGVGLGVFAPSVGASSAFASAVGVSTAGLPMARHLAPADAARRPGRLPVQVWPVSTVVLPVAARGVDAHWGDVPDEHRP